MARAKYKNPYRRFGFLCLALLVLVELFLALRPLPATQPQVYKINTPAAAAAELAWPGYGQAAVAASGYGVLAANGSDTPAPIASVAKIATALTILHKYPLKPGELGPTITLAQADVDSYQYYVANGGSVVQVASGEQISEYQALVALLLPSANNMADSLAIWAYGSTDAYLAAANAYMKSLGLTKTTLADASGFSPNTVSTAKDLAILALAGMNDPVLAGIVSQKSADVPVAGTIINTNFLLGSRGIVGIKTGNTTEAGGCFMFAKAANPGGQALTIVGAVMNAPNLATAMKDAASLADSAENNFRLVRVVSAGDKLAGYKTKWGASSYAVAQTNLSLLLWQSQTISVASSISPLSTGGSDHAALGTLKASAGANSVSVPLISSSALKKAPLSWRLTHW